ncbi:indolethylamine N-methyltransferase-like [Engystomops pustulosus]|uniref:indolethylamine N-methyltransferase-like n=1 Tax=Engystomops pustulosus TaxID=76066 RepID=UPI003AFAF4B4
MDPSSLKLYYVDDFDPRDIITTYGSPDSDAALYEEMTVFPLKAVQRLVSSGTITGNILTDLSSGPLIAHLIPMAEYFRDIVLMKPNYFCLHEMEKWQFGEEDSFNWSHLSELENDRNKWIEKEECTKSKIRNIMKCDLSKQNPIDPFVLSKADCMTCFFSLGENSIDRATYCENIRRLSSLLNVGGHLILSGLFNVKYFSIGEDKFHSLCIDEEFFRKVMADAGFIVEHLEKLDSKASSDKAKYDQVFLASAVKDREV